jgi:hypothetical protein
MADSALYRAKREGQKPRLHLSRRDRRRSEQSFAAAPRLNFCNFSLQTNVKAMFRARVRRQFDCGNGLPFACFGW